MEINCNLCKYYSLQHCNKFDGKLQIMFGKEEKGVYYQIVMHKKCGGNCFEEKDVI